MTAQGTRIRSLDGVRAFAIATVLLAHLQQRFHVVRLEIWAPDGVELFFVLSGFLITGILVREQELRGGVNLVAFYRRRATRILPALLVYLGVILAVLIGSGRPLPWAATVSAALFMANIYPQQAPASMQHLWSLALEEQFYLVWPLILLACLRWGGRRAATWASIIMIGASPVFRIGVGLLHPPLLAHRESILLPGRMDSLLAGALLALCQGRATWNRVRQRVERFPWAAPLFFLVLSPVLRSELGSSYTFTVGYTAESIAVAFFFAWLLDRPHSLASRALSLRPVAFFGVASYSVYLYQSFVIFEWPMYAGGAHPLLVLLVAILAGMAAYFLVEVPVALLRKRRPGLVVAVKHRASESTILSPRPLSQKTTVL